MDCEHSQWSLTIQTIKLSKILTFIFLSITFFYRRVNDAYGKTGFGGYFAKHHDAYKKMSVETRD